jgi:hypothetical protein
LTAAPLVRVVQVPSSVVNSKVSAWSPDGKWLVVRGPSQLAVVEVATGLTRHLGYSGNWMAPAWQR